MYVLQSQTEFDGMKSAEVDDAGHGDPDCQGGDSYYVSDDMVQRALNMFDEVSLYPLSSFKKPGIDFRIGP